MRAFGAAFDSLRVEEFIPEVFATIRLDFPAPTGTMYFSGGRTSVLGQTHEPIVTTFGQIASMANREEKLLDVSAVRVEFNNFPVLSTGERLSDVFDVSLETVLGRIYLNLADADGNVSQEEFFRGIVQSPIEYDYERAVLTLRALHEAYLNKSALRVIRREDFPAMRDAHVGATVPIVIGSVERTPGRVVKASSQSKPIADPSNTGNASLLGFIANTNAVSQDWTITVAQGSETHEQVVTTTQSEVGKSSPQVTVGNITTNSVAGGTSLSFSHNSNGEMLVVTVVRRGDGIITQGTTTLTYNGVAMTRKGGVPVEIWYLVNPASGANTLAASWSGNHDVIITALSIIDGSSIQVAPLGAQTGPESGGTSSILSGGDWQGTDQTNGLLLDVIHISRASGTITAAAGQTERTNTTIGGVRSGVSTKVAVGGTPHSMRWNISPSIASNQSSHLGVMITARPDVYAQSIQMTGGGSLAGAVLRLNKNLVSSAATARAVLSVMSDSGGAPSATVLGTSFVDLTSTSPADVTFGFSTPIALAAATTYWLVLWASRDGQANGDVMWGRNAAGGYASGNAQKGRQRIPIVGDTTIEWVGGMAGEDFAFQLLFGNQTTYSFLGSVSGADGSGSVQSDSTSLSGQVTILASHWQGTPAAGDRFYFSVDASENGVILSESPSDTPVSDISTVYWNDVPIEDASIEQTTYVASGTNNYATSLLAADGFANGVAQAFEVTTGLVIKSLSFMLAKKGAPTQPVSLAIHEGIGTSPSDTVLASAELSASQIAGTFTNVSDSDSNDLPAFAEATLETPLALPAGTYFITASTTETDAANFYRAYGTAVDVLPGLTSYRRIEGTWRSVGGGADKAFKITAVTLNRYESADDGTGENVARVGLDVAIPDDVEITADVIGITDDSSGTYTGIAGALLTTPADVFHWLLRRADVPAASIDLDGTFEDTKASHGGLYRFDGTIQDNETWKALLLRLAFECRCAFDWPVDTAQLKFLRSNITDADATISFVDIVGPRPEIRVSRSDTTKLVNFVDIRYERQHRLGRDLTSYQRIVNALNSASITLFGQRENPEKFFCDFVRSEPMATDLAAYYANRLSNPRRIVEATTKLPFLHIEKDDSVEFNLVK